MFVFKRPVTSLLRWTSDLAHVVISVALAAATLLIAVFFFYEVYTAIQSQSLIKGFLHALGILLLLWTMVELISTEIRYLQGEGIDVAIFIEVALVVVVREIIMLPVEKTHLSWIDISKWTGAAALLGLTYALVRLGQRWMKRESPKTTTGSNIAGKGE